MGIMIWRNTPPGYKHIHSKNTTASLHRLNEDGKIPPVAQSILHKVAPLLSVFFLTLLTPGCTPTTTDPYLVVDVPKRFSTTGETELAERWWKAFNDPALNRLMENALCNNLSLTAVWYRLNQARSIVERESASLYPDLNLEVQAEVQEGQEETVDSVVLGTAATYEVDLWGRIESVVEAEKYRVRASLHDYQAAVLSLTAEVARSWYALVTARGEIDLLENQLETNRNIYRLINDRFVRGYVSSVDMLRQRQQVEATRERLIEAQARTPLLTHLLAVLSGQPPTHPLALPPSPLPDPPALPDTGLPIELVERRPDIRSAFNQLLAADRDLAAAIANQYPRLTLSASLVSSAGGVDDLFEEWLASFGGNLLAPLFDGGRRAAEASRFDARRSELLHTYGQATLTAFREVEDAMHRELTQHQRLESIGQQLVLAEKASQRLLRLYLNGAADYIDVLTARGSEQQLRRNLLAERGRLLEIRISLYRALAGGFMPDHLSASDKLLPQEASGISPES